MADLFSLKFWMVPYWSLQASPHSAPRSITVGVADQRASGGICCQALWTQDDLGSSPVQLCDVLSPLSAE